MKRHISHILTIAVIVGAISAMWSFQYVSPGEWSKYFQAQVVGQSARVEENPLNKLAQELRTKEQQLEEKEVELNTKEEFLLQEIKEEQERRNRYIMAAVIIVSVLMLANFYLDWKRGEREESMLGSIMKKINNS